MARTLRLLALIVLLASTLAPACGQEIITLRSGNGTVGSADKNITFFSRGDGAIGPFSSADFTAAVNGASAAIVAPISAYVASLPADPAAQWIAVDGNLSPRSALYAYSFRVNTQSIKSATFDIYYAVDNNLGDPSSEGLYINGTALAGSANLDMSAYGLYSRQYHFSASDVSSLLHPGTNTLYFYQWDYGGAAAAIFSASLAITPGFNPDLLVKKDSDPDSAYLGGGISSPTPIAAQSISQTVAPGGTAAYDVMAENTSFTASSFVVKAVESGDSSWRVTYRVGTQDITSLITGAGYTTDPLSPGGSVVVSVEMVSVPGTNPGAARTVEVDGFKDANDSTVEDSVQMVTNLTPIQDVAPGAPSNLMAASGDGKVSLSWSAPSVDGSHGPVVSYTVHRSTTKGGPYTVLQATVTATSYIDANVTNGSTYYYVVTAVNAGGESPPSNEANGTPNQTIFAPAAPSNLIATAGDALVSLSWTAPSTDASHGSVVSYNIKRSTTKGGPYTTVETGVKTTTFADGGVSNGTTYYYVITAINPGGESSPSNEASAIPPGPPLAPSNLSAKSTSPTTAILTWTINGSLATGFQVERAAGAGEFALVGTAKAGANTYDDSGLSAATTYAYRVSATNVSGSSGYSNTAAVTTVGDTISGVVVFSATGGAVPASGILARVGQLNSAATVASAVTDATGHYAISGLKDGSYTVTLDAPNQTTAPTDTLTLSGSVQGGAGTANFTLSPLATFGKGLAMVSVPFDYSATNVDAAAMFGVSLINGITPIAAYDPAAAQYLLYPKLPGANGRQTVPGQGYWILEASAQPLIRTGARVTTPFDAVLLPGWNLIGNPFLHPVPFSGVTVKMRSSPVSLAAAQSSGLVGTTIWTWDDTQRKYTAVSTLEPFVGCWIYIDPAVAQDRAVTVEYSDPSSD